MTTDMLDDDLEPQLEAAVRAVLSEPIPADAIDRVKHLALNRMIEREMQQRPQSFEQQKMLRIALPLFAVAASALVIIALFLPAPTAFAQVVEQIKQINTAMFTVEFNDTINSKNLVAQATLQRPDKLRFDFDVPSKMVNITNNTAGELISYDSDSRTVTVNAIPRSGADFDILGGLLRVDANAVKIDGPNTVKGTELYGIFDGRGRVWIDIDSKLPVRVEMTSPEDLHLQQVVYRDFQWDVPVDARVFQIPEGRTIVRSSLLATPTEAELIAAFEIRQAFLQAPYDADFLAEHVGLRLGQLAYDLSKNRAENAKIQMQKLSDHWATVGLSVIESQDAKLVQQRIDYLCMKLDQWQSSILATGAWVGAGVRPGESKPLCWWKSDGTIRVLYADLTIATADQPPSPQ